MKILSLEDDAAHAGLIRTALQATGHDVLVVDSGRLAIRHLETAHVNLLMLDWQVPNVSGFEVLCWARSHIGERIPALVLTCRYREDQLAAMFDAGADDYVIKPISARVLAARVNALLRRVYPDSAHNSTCIEAGAYQIDFPSFDGESQQCPQN
ncbi:response regulator transcription factor [Trinickia violacea]|uniref:Response regulator transcription factor n=1 Tax=Trinickia violacea TaxID=2571746 RepID=A0A4V1EIN9_9BURK|nr:response regulator transcription factor [Trinickia violacea]QCP54430.1 response regulator transcription factor [Trinickia violacea]